MNSRIKICLLVCITILPKLSFGQTVDEYTLKAIWIGKFTHFIDWPSESINNTDSFTIGSIYKDSFDGRLEKIFKDYEILNKPVKIIHLKKLADSIPNLQILFIPPLKQSEVKEIIEKTKNRNILLIGDTKNYSEWGVHLNFFLDNQRIRFEINESAIRESNFFVSYRLLNISKITHPIDTN